MVKPWSYGLVLAAATSILFVGSTDRALALCKPGSKNCITASPTMPKPCYKTARGCQIDGGLGSECKGGGANCGTQGQTLPNPNSPTGWQTTRRTGPSRAAPVVMRGEMRH